MFRRFTPDFALLSIGLDAALVAGALALATRLRPALNSLPLIVDILPIPTPGVLYVIFPLLWVLILMLVSIYDSKRNLRLGDELANLTLGSTLATVALAGTLYLSYRDVSRALFLTFALFAFLALVLWRSAYRLATHWGVVKGAPPRRVLIAGAGSIGRELAHQIHSYQELGLRVAGYLDDDPEKQAAKTEIIGTLDQARAIVRQHQIDDIVLALPLWAYDRVNRLVAELSDLPVKVWVIPDYFSLALHRATVDQFAGLPMFDLRAPALSEYQRTVKRIFDIVISLLLLALAMPLLLTISLAIRLDSHGPVLLRQKRVGENGRVFEMLKFRTMVANAEELSHLAEHYDEAGRVIHKQAGDPRITRIGRLLRRLSLDELPQLFNVLKGEMSLVGPRPELPYLVDQYEPWQRKRFAVPQGMTGWWQINGRSDRPMHLNTEDDLYYVQNYSILLDLQIMFKTVWVVLRGKGAY
ncbi:MAG TPA: sugar transferase [Anaerolineales bacterium]|nr:sugar transferase [Anaerolineales bacterium]